MLLTLIPGTFPSPATPPHQCPRARGGGEALWHCTDFELRARARSHSCKDTPTRQLSAKEVFNAILDSCARPCMTDPMQTCCFIPEAIACAAAHHILPWHMCLPRPPWCLWHTHHSIANTTKQQRSWCSFARRVRSQGSLPLLPGPQMLRRPTDGSAAAATTAGAAATHAGCGGGGERDN